MSKLCFAEAEPLFRQALEVWHKVYPDGNPNTAKTLNHLALLCRDQGRFAEAVPLFQQALAMRQQALPADHPDIVENLHNLAAAQMAARNESRGRDTNTEPTD